MVLNGCCQESREQHGGKGDEAADHANCEGGAEAGLEEIEEVADTRAFGVKDR